MYQQSFLLALLLLSTVSCSHMTKVDLMDETNKETIEREKTLKYYALGSMPATLELNESDLCPGNSKLSGIEFYSSPLDRLLTIYTLGIYAPKTLTYRCAQ